MFMFTIYNIMLAVHMYVVQYGVCQRHCQVVSASFRWLLTRFLLPSVNKAVCFWRRCICHIVLAPPRECSGQVDAAHSQS